MKLSLKKHNKMNNYINMSSILFLINFFMLVKCGDPTDLVLGCGGYIKSEVDINFSQVSLKLLTLQGNLKYETECAPNNGYYFIPLYDMGEYVLKVSPPSGWTFEPEEVNLKVDGESDPCSKNEVINFHFKGFAVVGKVISIGGNEGPAGVTVSLKKGTEVVMETVTAEGGSYVFTPLASGKYEVEASHPTWSLIKNKVPVTVKDQNGDAGSSLIVGGYTLSGKINTNEKVLDQLMFVLHSKVKSSHKLGCTMGKPAGYISQFSDPILCYASADKNGKFIFSGISPGTYQVVPFSLSPEMNYKISPQLSSLEMGHSDFAIQDSFQLYGCRLKGQVFLGNSLKPVIGASVTLNGNTKMSTNDMGEFFFEAVKFGKHKINVEADGVQFQVFEANLSLGKTNKFKIFPSKYEICFMVSVDSTTDKNTLWNLEVSGVNFKQVISTNPSGRGCVLLQPGKYTTSVLLSPADEQAGIRFGPEEHLFEVGSEPLKLMNFAQFLGEIQGTIECLESCKSLTVSLRPSRGAGTSPRVVTSSQGSFSFQEVVPGDYLLTVDKEEWCWKDRTITVLVDAKQVNAKFHQTGFRLTINSSHRTALKYSVEGGKTGEIAVVKGTSRECVSSPGKYSFMPSGCHRFEPSSLLAWDTTSPQLLTLKATHHMVSWALKSKEAAEFTTTVKHQSGEEVSLEPEKKSPSGVYDFDHWISEGDMVVLTPASPSNLFQFSPSSFTLRTENDCVVGAVSFVAERALFIKGNVKPPIEGIDILVTAQGIEPIHLTTKSDGSFVAGPLDKSLKYDVKSEKLGYTISPSSRQVVGGSSSEVEISFDAFKLAEINVKIVDEANKTPLSGVLVSTSGGKDYRQNSLTEADGSISFLALRPADYFVRPMMKEYTFSPPSKMVSVEGGATVNVEILGTRVAFSIFGQTASLSGEPEPEVVVEAIGTAPPCQGLQEEALSDSQGHFRIRGLVPKCDYEIGLKTGEGINAQVERSLPKVQRARVESSDLLSVRVIVLRPFLQMDVSAFVHIQPQFLQSLSADLYRENNHDTPVQTQLVGSHPFFMLPPMVQDGRSYTLRLRSSLLRSQYDFKLPSASFKANSSFVRLEFTFSPELKSVEAEISRGTVLAFILFVIAVVVVLNYQKIQPVLQMWADMYAFTNARKSYYKTSSVSAETVGETVVRKRVKLRKI